MNTIIEQIKAEIERLIDERYNWEEDNSSESVAACEALTRVLSFLSTLESEKPMNQEGLDENIKHYIEDCGWGKDSTIPVSFVRQIASYFYNLGCTRTTEKYDEIEYNRQRAEEQGSEELSDEISRISERYPEVSFAKLSRIAVHFAKWGAEHLADARKTSPNDLEDAAEQFYPQDSFDTQAARELGVACFVDGAKWDREQMMKDAVEGEFILNPYPTICLDDCKDYNFKDGQKVRIIIVKEDSHE